MTTILTGYDTTIRPNSTIIRNRLYLLNDFDEAKMWDGLDSSMRKMGIDAPDGTIGAPTQSTGSDCTNGDHLVRYRYVDSTSPAGIYRSNPSSSRTITVTSTQDQTFSITSSGGGGDIIQSDDPKVDTIVVEMTEADGTTYYTAGTATNDASTIVIAISDTSLIEQDASATYDDFGHEPPPLATCIAECRGFCFVGGASSFSIGNVTATNGSATVTGTGFPENIDGRFIRFDSEAQVYGILSRDSTTQLTLDKVYASTTDTRSTLVVSKTPSRIYWSRVNMPESFKVLTRARDMLQGSNDVVVGMADYLGDLWVFGKHSMERLVFVSDPASGERMQVAGQFGLWNQRCLVQIEGQMFGWGPNGIWVVSGGRPKWLSEAIDDTLDDLLGTNYSYSDDFHAGYDPQEKVVRWWFVETGETKPKIAVAYDIMGGHLSIDRYRGEINSATVGLDSNGKLHQYVVDDGYIWQHEGDTDGSPNSDRKFTADTGGTTTSIPVDETITGSSADWAGVSIYNVTQDLETILTGTSDSTTFTCDSWTAVADGDVLYVGSIPFKIKSPHFVSGDDDKLRPRYCHIHLKPGTSGSIRIRYYTDFSSTAENFGDIYSDDVFSDGVTIGDGVNYIDVDIDGGSGDGFVSIPVVADWKRAIQVEVECFDSRGDLRILDIKFSQHRDREQKDTE